MAFPPQFLDELRARADLAHVIGRRVKLIRRGREYVGLSPFQNEKTPSFTVVPDKGFYHCFSSGEHGDVIDFVMKTEGLSFPDAVERLAAEVGLAVPVDTPEERERTERRKTLQDVVEAAARHFEKMLRMPEGKGALAYLRDRGLDDDTIARFRLGFAPDTRSGLKGALGREGVSEGLMIEAGLLIAPEESDRPPYDRFRGRVMFPIRDRRGRVVAFGGRAMGDGEPKYLNSPETPLFHKGRMLYGLDLALKPARDAGTVLVTEGYMDVIALHRAGFENAVAPLGTALTEDQVQELWRIVAEPVLCFDGDAAGGRAAARAAERILPLLQAGRGLRFAALPEGEDPDSLIGRGGSAAMRRVLDAAEPLSDVVWRIEAATAARATPEDRAALWKNLRARISAIPDTELRRDFEATYRSRLWPDEDRPRGQDRTRNRRGAPPPITTPGARADAAARVDTERRREEMLLVLVLRCPELFARIGEQLGAVSFIHSANEALRRGIVGELTADLDLTADELEARLRAQGHGAAIDAAQGEAFVRWMLRDDGPLAGEPFDAMLSTWQEFVAMRESDALDDDIRASMDQLDDVSAGGELDADAWARHRALLQARLDHQGDD